MRCRRLTLWVCTGMVACGGAQPAPNEAPAAVTIVSQEPDVAPEPQPATVVDLVGRTGDVFVYFDAKAFREGAMYRAVMDVVNRVSWVREQHSGFTESCGFNPVEALGEIAFSTRVHKHRLDTDTAVLAARSEQKPAATLDCVARLIPQLERAEVDGYSALSTAGVTVVATEPFLVVGSTQAVRRALERIENGAGERVPRGFLYAELQSPEVFMAERIVVGVGPGPKGTEFEVHARATSVDQARGFESYILAMRAEGLEKLQQSELDSSAKNLATSLLESVMFERRGADLVGAFDFGSPEREAHVWSVGTTLVAQAIDRYLHTMEVSKARWLVHTIAYSLRDYAMSQKPPRFPVSAPLVPPQVPAASRYQSTEADWQKPGWKDIGFSWSAPQHYALGFETARGGRKVTVRALGDLDGDGQQARFELDLEIRAGEVVGDYRIREDRADE